MLNIKLQECNYAPYKYKQTPLAEQISSESVAKMIQRLNSEVNILRKKLKQTDLLLAKKEIYAQALMTDLNHALEYIKNHGFE